MRIPVAKEGFPFIIPTACLALLFLSLGFSGAGIFFVCLALFIVFFFRDPSREIPSDESLVISPADGKVVGIKKGVEEADGRKVTQVSIFLSVFNVHINRTPISGEVTNISYNKGKFMAAFAEKASLLNEQNSVSIKNKNMTVRVNQIAGLIARRIVCWVEKGQNLEKGERFGLIRFGSRVDIFLPETVDIKVSKGHKVVGGITIIGKNNA